MTSNTSADTPSQRSEVSFTPKEGAITIWREKLLQNLIFGALILGFFAYIPSTILAILEQLYHIAALNTVIYGWVVLIYFAKYRSYNIRATGFIILSFVVGLDLLMVLGPHGGGPVWLFAFPVLTGILLGTRPAIAALVLNALVLILVGILISTGYGNWFQHTINPIKKWVVVSFNFMLLSTLTTLSVTYIFKALSSALAKEHGMWISMKKQAAQIDTSNKQLVEEMEARRQQQKELRESEEKYRFLAENMIDNLWILRLEDMRFTYISPSVEKIFGFTPQEAMALEIPEHIPQKDMEKFTAILQEELARDNEPDVDPDRHRIIEIDHYHKNGGVVPTEIIASLLRDNNGTPDRVLGITRDISLRKQAEEQLRHTQSQIQAIYEAADNVSFIVTDLEGKNTKILEFSPGAEKIFGYSRDEVLGQKVAILHPDEVAKDFPAMQQGLTEKAKGFSGETTLIRKSGERFAALFTIHPYYDIYGNISGTIGVSIDISEQKKAEVEIRQNQERLNKAQSVGHIGSWEYNPATGNIWGSEEGFRIYGLPPQTGNLPIDKIEACIPEREKVNQALVDLIENKRPYDLEFAINPADGSPQRIIRSQAELEKDEQGNTLRIVGVIEDITDRKKAEDALRRSETLFRKVFEILPVGLWIADERGALQSGNPAGIRIWGGSPLVPQEEYHVFKARRLPSREEIAPDDWALAHTVNKGVTIRDELLEIDAFDGITRTLLNFTAPVLDDDGSMLAAIVVNQDITERRKLEEQLQQSQKLESIGILAGGIAHDFNNLLTAIIGYSELIEEKLNPSDPLSQDIAEIHSAADSAAQLTAHLLAFSRKQIIVPQVLDINESIEKTRNMLSRLISEDIEIAFLPGEHLWPVKADPGNMQQILINLAVNAGDAMSTGGRLSIETANVSFDDDFCKRHAQIPHPGDFVMLAVSDTGSGMDKETLAHIFEPFFTTKEKERGTGLGMSTVYGIVKQHGGFIFAYSEPDQGTTIKVYFPRTGDAEVAEHVPNQPIAHGGPETVLLAEDEDTVRRLAQRILEEHGYTVLPAVHGKDACKISKTYPEDIDLLLTDVVMPGLNGKELSQRIRSGRKNIQVLFMSGYTDDAIATRGILDEDTVFIQKPFTAQALLTKVREVLSSDPVAPKIADKPPSSASKTILVVDDEVSMCKIVTHYLKNAGYEARVANTGSEGIAAFSENPLDIDLVILDISLPDMQGNEVLANMRAMKPDIPVILSSGYGSDSATKELNESSHTYFLQKPFKRPALLAAINEALGIENEEC